MANLIERAALGLGRAVSAFKQATTPELRKRPGFITAWANSETWSGGRYNNAAKDEAQQRAIQNSWIYSAINEKCLEIASGKGHVYKQAELEDDAVQIPRHELERLLKRPNPWMGGGFLWQYTHWWMELDGNAYWFLAPGTGGKLSEIWPIPSNKMVPVPGDSKRFVDYYEYTVNGQVFSINAEFICHFKYPNPFNVFKGLSPLVSLLLPVDADLAMARWNGAFFGKSNTMPSAIISLSSGDPNNPYTSADTENIKAQLEDEYGASERKTVVTNANNMAVQLLGYNAKDMDFLAGRQATKEEIYQGLGYPPGYADKNSTEANATVGYHKFLGRIYNHLNGYAEDINSQIMARYYDPEEEFKFDDVRPGNKDFELQEATASKGDMTINERRKRFWNMPPVPWGDEPPSGSQPQKEAEAKAEAMGALVEEKKKEGINNPLDKENKKRDKVQKTDLAKSLAATDIRNWQVKSTKSLKLGKGASVKFESDALDLDEVVNIRAGLDMCATVSDVNEVFDMARKGMRSWRPWSLLEEVLGIAVFKYLADQKNKIINALFRSDDPEAVLDNDLWVSFEQDWTDSILPIAGDVAKLASERASQIAIGVDWTPGNAAAAAWAEEYAGELITRINETTRKAVAREIADWALSGAALPELADRIRSLKTGDGQDAFGLYRSEMIAQTESTNIFAGANAKLWESQGYGKAVFLPSAHVKCRCYIQPWTMMGRKVMVWYTAVDERVCTQKLKTPWGDVMGCRDLHLTVISEGPYLGKRVDVKSYNPNQPRDPAGSSTGGQWTSDGSSKPSSKKPELNTSEADNTNPDGSYTAERVKLHKKIIDTFLAGKSPVEAPVSYLFGGGPASGKGRLLENKIIEVDDNTVVVNADDIKIMLPEYKDKGAAYVHEESSYLSDELLKRASEGNYNTVLDGTGNGSMETVSRRIKSLRADGHEVHAVYISVPTETAVERAMIRAQKTGRLVPESVIRATHKTVSQIFPTLAEAGVLDSVRLYDNTGEVVLMAEGDGKKLKILDNDLYNKFTAKAKE